MHLGRIELGEACQMRSSHDACCCVACCALPPLAQQPCSRTQLRYRPSERERFKTPSNGVVPEIERAHFGSRRSSGRESSSVLRDAACSLVVTSVMPSRSTTTRSFTPNSTMALLSECTTLFVDSSACTRPCTALPSPSRCLTRPREDQVPTSSHPNEPSTTITLSLRSR